MTKYSRFRHFLHILKNRRLLFLMFRKHMKQRQRKAAIQYPKGTAWQPIISLWHPNLDILFIDRFRKNRRVNCVQSTGHLFIRAVGAAGKDAVLDAERFA